MGARSKVKMPKLGDTVDEVLVVEWHVEVGQAVEVGDTLMTVETDKVDAEVPAPVSGTLVERLVELEDEVPTGAPIAIIESS